MDSEKMRVNMRLSPYDSRKLSDIALELSMEPNDVIRMFIRDYVFKGPISSPIKVPDVILTPKIIAKSVGFTGMLKVSYPKFPAVRIEEHLVKAASMPFGTFCLKHSNVFVGSCGCSKNMDLYKEYLYGEMLEKVITKGDKMPYEPEDEARVTVTEL